MAKTKKANKSKARNAKFASSPASGVNNKDTQFIETKVKPLIESLNSESEETRSASLSEITLLCETPKNRTLFLKERLLKYILEILAKETNNDIITESYGLLRNISIEEGYDSTVFLWRQDILQAIKILLSNKANNVGTKDSNDLLENVVGLLSAMALSSDSIFDDICEKLSEILPTVLVTIVTAFSQKQITSALFGAACEALYIFSQDNKPFIKSVSTLPLPEILETPSKHTPLGLVYLNGLKYNSIQISLTDATEELSSVAPHILEVLQALNTFMTSVDVSAIQQDITATADGLEPKEAIALYKKAVTSKYLAEGVQISLEVVAAIAETISVDPKKQPCAPKPQEVDEDMEDDKDEDMELYIRKSVAVEETPVQEEFWGFDNNSVLEPTFQYLQEQVIPTLFKLLPHSEYLSRTLNVLNNLAWSLEANRKYATLWKQQAEQLWTELLPHVTTTENKPFVEIESINSSVGILWAIASFFDGVVPITPEAINFLISQSETISTLYPAAEASEHYVRLIGFFTVLAKTPGRVELTQRVGEYLLTLLDIVVTKGASAVGGLNEKVAIDVIYALFSIFGDGESEWDEAVFVQGGINQKLTVLLPKLRVTFKRISKVKDYALKEKATEATMNLARFIEYKKSELEEKKNEKN
ncbi:uncharacterized protein SAPINGB_P005301 [Magnusiomyces paraingens]|uniref:SYO1-like TPR repeats domain-containing protein n=1 Tax=Magnusiomyces paraingens TaxID=2606893 RepID=A0A5E8BZE3_9ASCO|nr:uncharacterized protein SAPINGB_P005301 [Saprochaete ingens]VVT56814.1 unnamed protein product [Saprochaete ingens]